MLLKRIPMNKAIINFLVIILIFFVIGFFTSLNGIFTGLFSSVFNINHFEANFVSFSFFLAYFIGSLFYVLCKRINHPFWSRLGNLGYKNLLLIGLIIASVGCLCFALGSYFNHYFLILVGLFIIGIGFSYLQISANPLILILGDPNTGTGRINLAQAFNSLATTLAPTVGVIVIYTYFHIKNDVQSLIYPYLFFAFIFLFMAIIINKMLVLGSLEAPSKIEQKRLKLRNQYKLVGGMLAIFCCVGLETAISSNLIAYIKQNFTISHVAAGKFLALHWGGFMIGRFLAATALNKMNNFKKLGIMLLYSIGLTALLAKINNVSGIDLWYFGSYQFIVMLIFLLIKAQPRLNIILFSFVVAINLIIVSALPGSIFTIWALVGTGLFNSIMFPTIFSLATQHLGEHREYASSLLVMMIVGGAIIPPLQGLMADQVGMNLSFIVPTIAALYVGVYGLMYNKLS
jgi:FHS family L-fucose permease-like MFS transporter